VWGFKVQCFKGKYGTKMEFPEGVGGFKQKAFRERGMDIFWNNTINQNYDKI